MTVQAPSRVRLAPITIDRSRVGIDLMCGLAATGVLLSAVVHFDLWYAQGFREVDTIGPLFLLNAIGGLVIGLVLICWRHWLPALAAAGFGAATLVAFYLSVTIGLFNFKEIATGEPQVLAEVAEYVALVFGVIAAWMSWRHSRRA
jgi:hypothetical protein